MLPNAVTTYLDDHRDALLKTLCELLRFPSIANESSQPDACQQCADWLAEHLRGLGLDVEVIPTEGKPNVLATLHVDDDAPTVLIYGHYDVQPVDPLDLWKSDPFEPVIRDGHLWARGANDDKGQLFTHLAAIEAWQHAGGVPINIKLFLEGEEEIGSPNIEAFVAERTDLLAADACVISDSGFFAPGVPSITYALRGLTYAEVSMTGPSSDLHSGQYGGAVANPVNGLARLVAALHDDEGRIMLEGFYDDVLDLAETERQAWQALPFDEQTYAAEIGLDTLGGGEKNFSALERSWARPTADCNGLGGGYTGVGAKTIIPSTASAKISFRLVPNQNPEKIAAAFQKFVAAHTPPGLTSTVTLGATARPVLLNTDSPAMRAGQNALTEAFGAEAVMIRCGASVPITEQFQRLLGLDAVLMGFGLPGDNIHSPNERFSLDQLWRGTHAAAAMLQQLAEQLQK